MKCKECYSENQRITPLNGARKCLENHRQYICATCGRTVCIDLGGERKARCFFPFSTKEMAVLYLKCAEIITGSGCGIYELIYTRGDRRYKIFASENELCRFLEKNRDIRCENRTPVYKTEEITKISPEQIRYLTKEEVEKYLSEKKHK
ncbi:MAG: hypothetical protein LBV26_02785 [Bacteroidales bacterium]|jgi:hypothetical protein|nr:hypothetical protein [Bacteroidales bacterium]